MTLPDPFFSIPGTNGSYLYKAEVNLLDADTAHCQQSVGQWVRTGSTTFDPLTIVPSDDAVFGSNVLQGVHKTVATVASFSAGLSSATAFPVIGSNTYTLGLSFRETNTDAPTCGLDIRWYDGGGGVISTVVVVAPTAVTSEFSVLSGQVTAPAAAVGAGIIVRLDNASSSWTAGELCEIDAAWLGESTTFVPSLRVVGDLDMRADAVLADWTPSPSAAYWFDKWSTGGFKFFATTSGRLQIWTRAGAATEFLQSTVVHGIGDGTRAAVRATKNVTTGVAQFFVDGAQLGGDVAGAVGPIQYTTARSLVVSQSTAKAPIDQLYYAEFRDGIDGPVVARFDPDDRLGL